MKFGGTSVANAEQIRRVGQIVRDHLDREPLVVVSAVGGMTDRLFQLRELLVKRNERKNARRIRDEIVEIHRGVLVDLDLPNDLLAVEIDEFVELTTGMSLIRECTDRTLDYLVSFGERLSARMVSAHLRSIDVASRPFDAPDIGLITDDRFGSARPLEDVDDRIREALKKVTGVLVVTGYIGRNERGEMTTLGRGGSDFTASIFGAALGAKEIQIWTDVDGVMTADPRIVDGARYLEKLSFAEASELAFYGAKVIHPATMIPAIRHGIPIRVLNTNRPEFEGTLIVDKLGDDERGVKSVTSKDHVAIVNIIAAPMLDQYGFMAKIAEVFSRYEVVIDMIATSEVSVSMTTDQRVNLDPVVDDLAAFSEVTVDRNKSIISVVGEGLGKGISARVFEIVRGQDVPVEMISYGATRMNLSFLTTQERSKDAVRALHRELFN